MWREPAGEIFASRSSFFAPHSFCTLELPRASAGSLPELAINARTGRKTIVRTDITALFVRLECDSVILGIRDQDWAIREIWIGEDSKSRATWRDSLGSADCRA